VRRSPTRDAGVLRSAQNDKTKGRIPLVLAGGGVEAEDVLDLVDDEGLGVKGDLAGAEVGVLGGEVQAEQAFGDARGGEVGDEGIDGGGDLGEVPVIADAVAVAEAAEKGLLCGGAGVEGSPGGRMGEHGAVDGGLQVGLLGGQDELRLDGREGVEGFAESEGEGGADFQEGEAVFDEGAVGGGVLVVGGVGFEDDGAGFAATPVNEGGREGAVVVDDGGVVELNAGLDDDGDDAGPGVLKAGGEEGAAMDVEGMGGGFGRGDGDAVGEGVGGAAGCGDFGADDVDGGLGLELAGGGTGVFGGKAEPNAAGGDLVVRQGRGIARAGHAGVEMDFAEASGGEGGDHDFGVTHGIGCGEVAPGIGAEMIAAEDEGSGGKTGLVGDGFDEAAEAGWLHTGVAAVLIDLVAGGFNKKEAAIGDGLLGGGAKDERMGGADGWNAGGPVGWLVGEEALETSGHERRGATVNDRW